MTNQDLQLLINIYNSLLEVQTKGTSSFIMTDCLRALQQFVKEKEQLILQEQKEE